MRTATGLLLAFVLLSAAATPAHADTRWATAVGERLYLRSADQEQGAERAAREACSADQGAQHCQLAEIRRDGGRWQAAVIVRREFSGSDEDQQTRADSSALEACRAQTRFERCRITERSDPQRSERTAESAPLPSASGRDRDERPSAGGETFGFKWTIWKSEGNTER